MLGFTTFLKNRSGATAIEYGLIAGFLSVAIIIGVTVIGTTLSLTFETVGSALAQ